MTPLYIPVIRTNMGLSGSVEVGPAGTSWVRALEALRQQWREAASRYWAFMPQAASEEKIEVELRYLQAQQDDHESEREIPPPEPVIWVHMHGTFPSYANAPAWDGVGAEVQGGAVLVYMCGGPGPSLGMLAQGDAGVGRPTADVYRDTGGERGWVRVRPATQEERDTGRKAVEAWMLHETAVRRWHSANAARQCSHQVRYWLDELRAGRRNYETLVTCHLTAVTDRQRRARFYLKMGLCPSRHAKTTLEELATLRSIEREQALAAGVTEQEWAAICLA
jgi:hypothetical protein